MQSKILTLAVGLILCSIVCSQIPAARKVSEEAIIFRKTRDAVFTIYGRGQGSGFLVDEAGLILTNSHVIGSSSRISVQLDRRTRVAATLLAEDKQRDIAVLRVAPEIVKELPILKIADRSAADLAFEGEKVIAIGSPLNQIRILTSGIVSKVEERAIISDVNINPGNSGGPLINMDSEVIAINTFGDFSSRGGPGVSGSILISLALPLLDSARRKLHEEPPPSTLLPVVPEDPFPIEGLKWAAERCGKASNYTLKAPGFNIQISTPSRQYFLTKISTNPLTEKRRGREAAAGVPQQEMYDPLGDRFREWYEYVGEYSPLVQIHVEPDVGETTGSLLLNILGAASASYSRSYYYGSSTYEFKSDLQDLELMDGGSVVPEIYRSMDIMPISFSERSVKMEDIAQRGVFVFLPEVFKSPNLRLKIFDLKKPGQIINVPIPQACREQILVDFEPYMDMQNAADARLRFMVEQ